MHGSIEKQLGVLLADCEERLYRGDDSVETVKRIALISDAYRNFAESGLAKFVADFDTGYAEMLHAIETEERPVPSSRELLGDYFGPERK